MRKRLSLLFLFVVLAGSLNIMTVLACLEDTEIEGEESLTEPIEISEDFIEQDVDSVDQVDNFTEVNDTNQVTSTDREETFQLFSSNPDESATNTRILTGMEFVPDEPDIEIVPDANRCFKGTITWKYTDETIYETVPVINGQLVTSIGEEVKLVMIDKYGNSLDGSDWHFWFEDYTDASYIMYFQYQEIKSNSFEMNIKHKDLSNIPLLTLGNNTVELSEYSLAPIYTWYKFIPEETGIYYFCMDYNKVATSGIRCVDLNGNPESYIYYIQPGEQWTGKFNGMQLIKGINYYIGVSANAPSLKTGNITIRRIFLDNCQWEVVEKDNADCLTESKITETCKIHKGETKTSIIPAGTHHTWKWVTIKEATAVTTGEKQQQCQLCNAVGEVQEIEKLPAALTLNVASKKILPMKVKQKFIVTTTGFAKGDKVKKWTSSNREVAIVSASGKITAKKPGITVITITLDSGYKTWFKVKIQKKAVETSHIKVFNLKTGDIIPKKIILKPKEKIYLSVSVTPVTSRQNVVYRSSKKSVVTINSKGVISTKKKGSAVITIKSGNKSVKCKVTVR